MNDVAPVMPAITKRMWVATPLPLGFVRDAALDAEAVITLPVAMSSQVVPPSGLVCTVTVPAVAAGVKVTHSTTLIGPMDSSLKTLAPSVTLLPEIDVRII